MKARFEYHDGEVLQVKLEPETREESLLLQIWSGQAPEGLFRFSACGIGGSAETYPGYRYLTIAAVKAAKVTSAQ